MAINVSQAFHRTSANPVDDTMALTKAEMLTVNDNLMPDYYLTVCQDDGFIYLYNKSAVSSETTGKFSVFKDTSSYTDLSGKPSINDIVLTGNKTFEELGITAINDLANYYLKSEVNELIGSIVTISFQVVEELPTENIKTNIIYLVPSEKQEENNIYDEYIYINAKWELIGSTKIDLSGYVTTEALNTILSNYTTTTDLNSILAGKQDKNQYSEMPAASEDTLGKIIQYIGTTTDTYTNGYFYECISDGENPATYSWTVKLVQAGGSGGGSITENITANITVGGINSGTTIESGTSLTELMKKMLIKETAPSISFSASSSGVKEVGTSVTPTLTLSISNAGTGTPSSIAFYSGSTLLNTQDYVSGTSTYTFTMTSAITTTTTVKGILTYKKSDGSNSTVEKSATYTFVMASYYGAVTSAPTTKADIVALTKNVKNTKALTTTYNLSNQKSCYCYPASFGNLSSIKDSNNFEYLGSYTKTNVTVDGTSYNVYTLTDPVTAASFKQIFA